MKRMFRLVKVRKKVQECRAILYILVLDISLLRSIYILITSFNMKQKFAIHDHGYDPGK